MNDLLVETLLCCDYDDYDAEEVAAVSCLTI